MEAPSAANHFNGVVGSEFHVAPVEACEWGRCRCVTPGLALLCVVETSPSPRRPSPPPTVRVNIQGLTTTPGVLSAILHAPDTVRLRMLGSVACRALLAVLWQTYAHRAFWRRFGVVVGWVTVNFVFTGCCIWARLMGGAGGAGEGEVVEGEGWAGRRRAGAA